MHRDVENRDVDTQELITMDKAHCWHPFTRQDEWEAGDPVVLESGDGVWLTDTEGKRYIDGNASIWTNVHGHNHPVINGAIRAQLERVSHTSYLGFANPRASELAARLVGFFPETDLQRVFFSDDGSTAMECALKMAVQYRMQTGEAERVEFVAFDHGYHGDTVGAASLGGVGSFFDRFRKFGFEVTHVESLGDLERLGGERVSRLAGVVIEPLVQGVNQINLWPSGMLGKLRSWCDVHDVHLILDEVMTGFGKTGTMFACQQEDVVPDFLCLAKGLTGGYLPLAATLTTGRIYDAFRGGSENAFYYGHSYTGNQLGCAAALASLDVFESEGTLDAMPEKEQRLSELLGQLREKHGEVAEIRRCGLIVGVELRELSGAKFDPKRRVGEAVCVLAREYGLLTRPILDTVVLMPPLAITLSDIGVMVDALDRGLGDYFGR